MGVPLPLKRLKFDFWVFYGTQVQNFECLIVSEKVLGCDDFEGRECD